MLLEPMPLKAMLRKRAQALGWAGVLAGVVAACPCARADSGEPADEATRTAARALGTSGVRAYLEGNAVLARERLERSYELYPTPTLGLWSARALVKLGLFVEAAERYAQVARLSVEVGDVATQVAARDTAAQERSELIPRIPTLRLSIVGASGRATLTLDGRPLDADRMVEEISLNPGQHEAVAQDERARVSKLIALQEGQHEALELVFAAAPSPGPTLTAPALPTPQLAQPPSAATPSALSVPLTQTSAEPDAHQLMRTAGWVGVGVGSAALGTALVTYFVGLPKHDDIANDEPCTDDPCQRQVDAVDGYRTLRTVNLVSWIAAGAFGAAGVTLLLLSRGPSGDVKLTSTGSSLGLSGTF
jgi:hypothetical protein